VTIRWIAIACLLLALPPWVGAQQNEQLFADTEGPIIADIVVEGGRTLTVDTVSYYLGLYPGDPFDPTAITEGYHRLWESGLVEDIRFEVEEVADGEVMLYVVVEERPFVTTVEFEGNKKIKTTSLKDRLDELGVDVPRNVPLRMAQLSRIQSAIKDVYDADGFRSADVDFRIDDAGGNKRKVVYLIDEGAKVKIEEIDFIGNEVFGDSKLRGALKKTKQTGIMQKFGKKTIYSEENWDEDRDNLRKFYLNRGYKDIKIGDPQLELIAKKPDAATLKKMEYRLHVTIPVEEGEPYTMGSLEVDGAEVYNAEAMARVFEVRPGQTYSFKAIEKGMESIQNMYHNSGYIYAYANQVLQDSEDEDHVVDVVINVFEGDRFQLGRLEFAGNTTTRDKVLRREFRLPEGAQMSMGVFRSSVFKVNALGYFKLEEEPLEFDFDDEAKRVNVLVKGQEVGRNDIQFGAGYSELDGFFAQAQFNTRNFLGRGNSLGVSVQVGRRTDYYTLSYTEPYFLDRRILLGASIFKTNVDITDFVRETTGITLSTGLGVGIFSSVSARFSFEDVYSEFATQKFGLVGDPTGGHGRPVDPPPVDPRARPVALEVFEGRTSSVTPAYNFDSRDDPFNPNRGTRFNSRLRMAGGILGGDFDYIRPEVSYTSFMPLRKQITFAYRGEVGQFFVYNESEIPLYERYRLGGDRTIRGIPYYTVLPRTAEGRYFLTTGGSRMGGDRYWLANLELQYAIGGPVKLVLFTDIGNTYHEDQGWDVGLYRHTVGAEMRIFLPIFQAPIRFIYGINMDPFPDEDSSDFQFSIGTTF
jgi:outer membrane protein insertion porin family